jgi:O-antigen ligase
VITPLILFVTTSRTGIAVFGASLILLVSYDRDRIRNGVIVLTVSGATAALAMSAAQSQFAQLRASVSGTRNTNAILSGRVDIWEQAQLFLRQGNNFIVGGGLDAFRDFAARSSLGNAFATHSAILFLLATGGLVLLAAYALLLVSVWLASSRAPLPVRNAIRFALMALIVIGLANDATLIARMGSWIWLLLGVGIYLSTDAAAARNRSAIAETS